MDDWGQEKSVGDWRRLGASAATSRFLGRLPKYTQVFVKVSRRSDRVEQGGMVEVAYTASS